MALPATEANYPPPSPPPTTRDEMFQQQDYVAVDQRAKQAPGHLVENFSELISYLTSGQQTDLQKVRAIFVWLSAQPVLTRQFPKMVRPDTPVSYLRRCKFDREVYTDLFALLCRKAGLPCAIIEGSTKGAGWEVGQEELQVTSRWNAVHVQDAWRLVNVPWALVTTGDLEQQGGWIKVEEDGRPCRESVNVSSSVQQDMDEFWFLTDPETMACFCYPEDPRWQLLSCPWSKEDFISTPRFAQEMMTSGWELVSDARAVLEADEGKCKVTFSHPSNTRASLHYNLYFNVKLSNTQLPEELQLDKYVLKESRLDKMSVVTRLPVEGVYRIQFAGSLDEDELTPLAEFRINCVNIKQKPVPFPCDKVGYGETARSHGLLSPSHTEGVVETQKGEKVDFRFSFKDEKPLIIKPKLLHNERTPEELSKFVTCNITDKDVNIRVTQPDNLKECALSIDAQTDDQAVPYYTLVAYLLTQDAKLSFKTQEAQVKVRHDLVNALREGNTKKIRKALQATEDMRLELDPFTRSKIEQVKERQRKNPNSKLSALTEAMRGDNIPELQEALDEYKIQDNANKQTLQHATAILLLLQAMKDENDVDSLETALASLLKLRKDDFGHIVTATYTLRSHYEKVVWNAYCQRSLPALDLALDSVGRSCLAADLQREDFYLRAVRLQKHLRQLQRVRQDLQDVAPEKITDLGRLHGKPNPHLQSTLMAVFILLGENEKELWEWNNIQKLLHRKPGLPRALADIDLAKVSSQQAALAEKHVTECQHDLLLKQNGACAALLLDWVRLTAEEKRGRKAMENHMEQITNSLVSPRHS